MSLTLAFFSLLPPSAAAGVYAWQARSGEGAFQLPSDDESAGSDVLHMAIYIHFEQLLGSHPHTMSAYVVPQVSSIYKFSFVCSVDVFFCNALFSIDAVAEISY